jgi:hypothetical protein
MRKRFLVLTGLSLLSLANAAPAQDVGGAFNMGQLTGTLSQDHVTQSERARSSSDEGASARTARTARNCASVSTLKARYGDDPRIGKIVQLCRQGGYAVR